MTLAELSRFLISPVTLVLYTASMLAYLWAMAVSVDRRDGEVAGRKGRVLATSLAVLGVAAHLGHIVTRSMASDRLPLGNMFEFSSAMALTAVVGGLVVFQWRMRRPEIMGFIMLGTIATIGVSFLVYAEPGPLAPILDSWWRAIHVSTIALAAGVFTIAAPINALHLLRDTAERRVADSSGRFAGSTVGAAYAGPTTEAGEDEAADRHLDALEERANPDVVDVEGPDRHDAAYRAALRASVAQTYLGVTFPWHVAAGTALTLAVFGLVFQDLTTVLGFVAAGVALTVLAWWSLPYLPSASTLDSVAYRTIAFGFPIWTFAVITGAIWAEQSWGRYWGWDPKETSAFLTWVAYAGYLHARATTGMRRRASWLGLVSFGVLMFTYFAVNLLITGLHSYAGL
jgi:ABC-type transport system involved in cytochrome c biogenesis permease subunit